MRTLIEGLAGLAILTNAVIYDTDVFSHPATQSSTRESRCRPSPSPRYASRSPRPDHTRGRHQG